MNEHVDQLVSLFLLDPTAMTEDQCAELSRWITSDAQHARQFVRDSLLHRSIHDTLVRSDIARNTIVQGGVGASELTMEPLFDKNTWKSLAEHELEAEPIEPEVSEPEPSQQTVRPMKRRKTHKSSLFTIILSAAAVLFICIYVRFTSTTSMGVATIVDNYNANMCNSRGQLHAGDRLFNGGDPYRLTKGIVEIEFDQGARVVIEAPAEISLRSSGQMTLNSGQLYARVSEMARGFIVDTPISHIVDLGTEFGVKVASGESDVHMIKGRASLIPDAQGYGAKGLDLVSGQAKRVDSSGHARDLPLEKTAFARTISSQNNFVWRGEDVSLADIVGGAGAFGSGLRPAYLNPADSQLRLITGDKKEGGERLSQVVYRSVLDNPLVDGLFVPNGQDGPVTVTSAGHVFAQFPATTGKYWYGVINWGPVWQRQIILDDVLYGTDERPALLMHSNVGITFDLDAIRRSCPGLSITEFTTVYGISDAYGKKDLLPNADFWILVDGELKFSKRDLTIEQIGSIRIPLSNSDRFLTLASTEGAKNDLSDNKSPIFNDWCVWGNPVLKVE